MIRVAILLLLVCPLTALSQQFIGKNKVQVKKELEQQVKNDTLRSELSDKDSVLTLTYKDPGVKPVDFIYSFDRSGKCWSEKVVAGCDTCFKKYFNNLLSQKKYEWKKINENQYVSSYSRRMMIELPPDNIHFTYTILHTDWTKELYQMLTGN